MCGHHWVESKAKSYEDAELGKRRDRRRGWEQCYLGRSCVDLGRSWTLELCAHQAATGVTSQRPQPLSLSTLCLGVFSKILVSHLSRHSAQILVQPFCV